MDTVLMRSPAGEEKEVEATAAALTPFMAAGWHQAPAKTPAVAGAASVPAEEEK
jgi:hypothetical protein